METEEELTSTLAALQRRSPEELSASSLRRLCRRRRFGETRGRCCCLRPMPSCMRQHCSGFPVRARRSSGPMWRAPPGFWPRPGTRGRGLRFTSVRPASSWTKPVRPSAMPMRGYRHFRTTSRPTWQARYAPNRSCSRPTGRTSAPSLSARRHFGGGGDPFSRARPQAIDSGQFAFINRGDYAFDTCHVDNAAEAVRCALERGEGGRAWFITDQEKLTFRQFVASLAGVQGLSIEKLRAMPYSIASALGQVLDAAWATARKDANPPISRSLRRMIGREFTVNDASARRELGYVGRTSRAIGLQLWTARRAGSASGTS